MSESSPTMRAKRRQIVLGILVLLGVFAIATIGVALTTDSTPAPGVTRKADIKTKSYIAPGETVDPKDAWRGNSDARLNSLEQKFNTLEAENRNLKARLGGKDTDKENPALATGPSKSPEQMSDSDLDKRLAEYEKGVEKSIDTYPAGTPSHPVSGQIAPAAPARQAGLRMGSAGPATQPAQVPGIVTVRLARPADTGKLAGAAAIPSAEKAPKAPTTTTQNYLPSGMFGRAILLSGLDAPTGGQAQSNPHPVLLQLLDPANLPNQYRYDWEKCLITAAGYGDLSSERGYIRTESLSCVSRDGRVLDVPIKGYIVGEDGKAGVRGRLVSKQGQVLSNALLAGVVSGIGSGIERSSTIQSVSPLGSTSSVKSGQEFQSGIGAGVGKSLDRLATYYITLAEKMFPVIEIDAARVVDVVLTQGVLVDAVPNKE